MKTQEIIERANVLRLQEKDEWRIVGLLMVEFDCQFGDAFMAVFYPN